VPKVDLDQIGGVVQSLTDFKDFVDTGYVPVTHSVALVDTTTTNTDMVGTDNAALASVLGALNNVAAAGEVTDVDTLMQYIKQLINILIGTPGITAFPAEAAPGNAVSLAEVIRAIHADVTGLNGSVMVGTNGANTDKTGFSLSAAGIDSIHDEEVDNDGTAISLRGAIKLLLAVLTGKSSGGGTATLAFRDVNDAKNRISATVDADGNRTAVGTRDAA
jgi:hypothetical protein